MGNHFIRVVEDGALGAEGGWTFAEPEDAEDIYFIAERSAVLDEQRLSEAWAAAQKLVIERAVREGIVQYVNPTQEAAQRAALGGPLGGRRVGL